MSFVATIGQSGVISGEVGNRYDWISNVLGQEIFGKRAKGYVSVAGGVSRPVVRLPPVEAGADASQLASFFRVASGIAMRSGYTSVEVPGFETKGSVSSEEETLIEKEEVSASDIPCSVSGREGFSVPGQAGELLNAMNSAVLSRLGASEGAQIASGQCYEVIFRTDKKAVATERLKRWPTLREILQTPHDWLAQSDDLKRVGVSVRDGNLHFELGWGDGVLTAFDLISLRFKLLRDVGGWCTSLLDLRVGGEVSRPDLIRFEPSVSLWSGGKFSDEDSYLSDSSLSDAHSRIGAVSSDEDEVESHSPSQQNYAINDPVLSDLAGYVAGRDGKGYLSIIRPECQSGVLRILGSYPDWEDVMQLSRLVVLPPEELLKIGVWNVGKFVAHIGPSSPGGGVVYYLGSLFEVFSRFCETECIPLPVWVDVDTIDEVPGYCYSRILAKEYKLKVVTQLGKYPTWRQILFAEEGRAVDMKRVEHHAVGYSGSTDTLHLTVGPLTGFPCDILIKYYKCLLAGESGFRKVMHSELGSVDSRVGGTEVMSEWLVSVGVTLPQEDLQLVSSTPALLAERDKHKYRMFEAVGDAVITLRLAVQVAEQLGTVEEYQNKRSAVTSNVALARVFSEKVPAGAVDCASGVDLKGKTGAKALEAIVGAVYLHFGVQGVGRLFDELHLF